MRRLALFMVFCLACIATGYSQPVFKGGQAALKDFISGKIVYPEYSRQNCISGTVQVRFTLDKAGNVTEAKIHQGLGIDIDDEALRVVELTSGQWEIPAGYNTATQIVLPVSFTADQSRCASTRRQDIDIAIMAYKNRRNMEDVVTHYYKSKYEGKADSASETTIINLKKQLGFDDDLITEVLDQADEKLKQGDKAGACEDWYFIRNIGSTRADKFIDSYCK
ncbi:MAG: energy transducer TonB [Cytophagaceae bacterium]|nr:MAG: energy transducer TonB [Cytophagaceae bacterium]